MSNPTMQFGLDMPNMGACGTPQVLVELALAGEEAGWDAIFVWDTVYAPMRDPRNEPTCDPWIALAAIAARTRRIRFGTMVTPITRRRPWKLARETVSLDLLSGGRLILPVGLGSLDDGAFSRVGEVTDRKTRARRLDEGLAILDGLWSGEPFSFSGEHFHVDEMKFLPKPVQSPRIPIWAVGAWPRPLSMQRAIRWDGILPQKYGPDGQSLAEEGNALAGGMTPADIREMKTYIEERRVLEEHGSPGRRYDIVIGGDMTGKGAEQAVEIMRPYAEAGATWWLESIWKTFYAYPGDLKALRKRIEQGPPQL